MQIWNLPDPAHVLSGDSVRCGAENTQECFGTGGTIVEKFENLTEAELSSEAKYDGDLLHIRRDTVRLPNGKTATREYNIHYGAVCVIPLLENGDVLLERQYRYPLRQVITEIPAGKLDAPDENPLEAAKRELREETGATAREWHELGLFCPVGAYSTETIHMFLATGLTFGERELDEDEFLNVFRMPLRELAEQVVGGKIPDAKTQAAAMRALWMVEHGRVRL